MESPTLPEETLYRARQWRSRLLPWLATRPLKLPPWALEAGAVGEVFARRSDGTLEIEDDSGVAAEIHWPLRFAGGSFELSFDVELLALDYSQNLKLGFFMGPKEQDVERGVGVSFSTTSGQACSASALLVQGKRSFSERGDPTPGRGTPCGVWLHARFLYDEGTQSLGLILRRKQDGTLVGQYFCEGVPRFTGEPLPLCLRISQGSFPENHIHVRIQHLKLLQPESARPIRRVP